MHSLNDVVARLIKAQIPFFLYKLPDSDSTIMGYQFTPEVFSASIYNLDFCNGFIFAPFQATDQYPVYFIRADKQIKITRRSTNDFSDIETDIAQFSFSFSESSDEYVVDKNEYLQQCTRFIELIQNGDVQKAILSRVISTSSFSKANAGELFELLSESYPSAFVFLVHIPGITCWMGASPETLLSVEGEKFTTMSLAGTQKWKEGVDQLENWTNKDRIEQQIVTDYIENKLLQLEIPDLRRSSVCVKRAGDIGHLLTQFEGSISSNQIHQLIELLHPTPAVCGAPKTDALELIQTVERHKRSYYAGYLGPVLKSDNLQLFVNLRCAELKTDHALLFVGGGITAESDPEKEWEETCLKAQTILNVLKIENE